MKALQCNSCGAQLLPDANFCRQCGAGVTGAFAADELPKTAFAEPADNITTQRLYPRDTGDHSRLELRPPGQPAAVETPALEHAKKHPLVFGIIALFVLLISIAAVVAVVRVRTPTRIVKVVAEHPTAESDLVYPGASKVLDVTGADGTRVLQLRTDDPLDSVHMWYDMNLHPTKTLRISDFSVILKNDKVAATLLSENNKTTILIKQFP